MTNLNFKDADASGQAGPRRIASVEVARRMAAGNRGYGDQNADDE